MQRRLVPLPREPAEPAAGPVQSAVPAPPPAEGGLESTPHHEPGTRTGALDGLRALAALAVVGTHVGFESGRFQSGALGAVIGRLDVGVAVFFVLSGFLLGRPFARWAAGVAARPGLARYAARRAVRVLPAYWLMLTVGMLVLQPEEVRTAGDAAWQYLLGQTYGEYRLIPEFSHVWSLSAEVAFYAALPLLALPLVLAARARRGAVALQLGLLAAASAAGLVLQALAHAGVVGEPGLTPQWMPSRFDWFAWGLALAVLSTPVGLRSRPGRLLSDLATAPGLCWSAAAALFWIACSPIAGGRGLVSFTASEAVVRELLYGLVAVLLVAPLVAGPARGGLVRTTLQSPAGVWLGQVSYGIFLWHKLVLELVERGFDLEVFAFPFWPVLLGVVVITLGLAWASWILVERPLLELVDRRLARRARAEQRGGGGAEREQDQQLRDSRVGTG